MTEIKVHLNMKNLLVDDNENVYIVDFSETRMSNVLSDFARLEPIVKFELTRLETERDLKELVEFEWDSRKSAHCANVRCSFITDQTRWWRKLIG